jgi:lipid II:glycine glycyltransferase (peptidoglycan interpeptide bridge formation enzyme)
MDTKVIERKEIWEGFLKNHPEANFLHSWFWGEFQKSLGRKISRIGFIDSNEIAGIMFSYIETSKRGRFLVVPGGPIIDWKDKKQIDLFVQSIRKIAGENGCIYVRVRPQLQNDTFSREIFKKNGFINAPMYLHAELTSQLDITKSEDEMLSSMRKATRYEVKKALKTGIVIEDTYNEKTVDKFIKLQAETALRQKFVPFSKEFLISQFEIFINNGLAKLYTAKYNGKILAQAFIIFYGKEAVYHYGVSSEEGRRYPGAYLIQWEAIREAKRRGLTRYNFWGVSPYDSKDHRFSGLSLFKRGFGGQDFQYLQAQDLIIQHYKYFFNYLIEKIRRKARRV